MGNLEIMYEAVRVRTSWYRIVKRKTGWQEAKMVAPEPLEEEPAGEMVYYIPTYRGNNLQTWRGSG